MGGKKKFTKSVCGAAVPSVEDVLAKEDKEFRCTMGSRLSRWSSNGLFDQLASGVSHCIWIRDRESKCLLVEIKVA